MSTAALATAVKENAVATRPQPSTFPQMLEQWKPEIARALPKHLNADRMARIALTCFRNVPKLGECDPKSVFAAVIQAAQLGIEPGLMGEAHLVPFGKNVQLIPGYQGLIKLAKQTGQVVDIYAMAVREKDKFKARYGLARELEHDPLSKNGFPAPLKERGEIIGVYAVARFKDGSSTFVIMGRDEIEGIRNNSQGYKSAKKYGKDTPWETHFEEMANKTAIRKLCKTLPKSPELAQALALEDAHYKGQSQKIDLKEALDNSYQAPVSDDVIDIDPTTGEIIHSNEKAEDSQPAGVTTSDSAPKAASTGEAAPAAANMAATGGSKKITRPVPMKEIVAMLRAKRDAEARDLVRSEPYTDGDRAEVESCIKHRDAGEQI